MNNCIQMISPSKFRLKTRGNDFTLTIKPCGTCEMIVLNAAVKAYRNGHAIPREFNSLKEVEDQYKSWRGISDLVNSL